MVQPVRPGAVYTPARAQSPSAGGVPRPSETFGGEVRLSSSALRLRDAQSLLRGLLTPIESTVTDPEMEEIWRSAGRDAYLESSSEATDRSPEATAERILGGITGYIYSAFRRTRPELDRGDLAHFESEVRRGFERGLAQVADLLEALGAQPPGSQPGESAPSESEPSIREARAGIEVTRDLVYRGLDAFLAREREHLAL